MNLRIIFFLRSSNNESLHNLTFSRFLCKSLVRIFIIFNALSSFLVPTKREKGGVRGIKARKSFFFASPGAAVHCSVLNNFFFFENIRANELFSASREFWFIRRTTSGTCKKKDWREIKIYNAVRHNFHNFSPPLQQTSVICPRS